MFYKYLILILLTFIYGCSNEKVEKFDVDSAIYHPQEYHWRKNNKGKDSILKRLFIDKEDKKIGSKYENLPINPYLWKASLNVLSSTVPIASVDSSSGIIISDWYNLKNNDSERVKITVLVNSIELRADGVSVKIFKQIKNTGQWKNVKVNRSIVSNLEKKIIQTAGKLAAQ